MRKSSSTLNGFLDQGCAIRGDVVFSDLLRVHGKVEGTIASDKELLVGEGGEVDGEVRVGRLVVAGTVRGTVHAAEKVVIHRTGKVFAEVFAATLVIDEGGLLEGPVHMARPDSDAAGPS